MLAGILYLVLAAAGLWFSIYSFRTRREMMATERSVVSPGRFMRGVTWFRAWMLVLGPVLIAFVMGSAGVRLLT